VVQVDFQSFAEHDLQESDGRSKSAKSRAKDLAKDESSTWPRNDDTKDDQSAVEEKEASLGIHRASWSTKSIQREECDGIEDCWSIVEVHSRSILGKSLKNLGHPMGNQFLRRDGVSDSREERR
jgi:hypothetical protein